MKQLLFVSLAAVILSASGLIVTDAVEARGQYIDYRLGHTSLYERIQAHFSRLDSLEADSVKIVVAEHNSRSVRPMRRGQRWVSPETSEEKADAPSVDTPSTESDSDEPSSADAEPPQTTDNEPEVEFPEVVEPEVISEPQEADSGNYLEEIAAEIHRLTNKERSDAGRNSLRADSDLAEIAEAHSEDMAKRSYFSHTSPEGCNAGCRLEDANYDAWAWGENIAWRSSTVLPSAKEIATHFVENWMNSSGHRHNILSDSFTHQGIGLAQIGNKVYVTVNFADPQ